MKEIILATHGHLSEEFKATLELIVGPTDNIRCFCMTKEKSAETGKAELARLIADSNEAQLIVMTDLFGGSAANICAEFLMRGHSFRLIAGLNLPMLLTVETADSDDTTTESLTQRALDSGGQGVIDVNKIITEGVG
jgi:PTS system mannose-specific IIA component/fructoselysine and glucoselysine-specific PTS system IIA component